MIHSLPSNFVAMVLCAAAVGCASDTKLSLLEGELREQSSTIRELRQDLERSERTLVEQDRELGIARAASEDPAISVDDTGVAEGTTPQVSKMPAAWGSVTSIRIHSLTSGLVTDGEDQVINVVVQPLDSDNELVKVAGELIVTAAIVTPGETPKTIASQQADITQSRSLWNRTLLSSGFHLQMALEDNLPEPHALLLTATLSLGKEHQFSTTELLD